MSAINTSILRLRNLVGTRVARGRLTAGALRLRRRAGEELRRGKSLVAVLVLLLAVSAGVALTGDGIGAGNEARELQAAVATMTTVVDDLPDAARAQVETEVRVLAQSIGQTLARIQNQPSPVVDSGIAHDLTYLTDIVGAINRELLAARDDEGVSPAGLAGRVRELGEASPAPLERLDSALARWLEQTGDAVLQVSAGSDAVIIETTDRLLYDVVRYAAAALFMIALLVLGMRLLALGETGLGVVELFRQAPVMTSAGAGAVMVFLLGSLAVAISPGVIAGPTRVLVEAREHPCGALSAQREQLREARRIGNDHLVEAIKERMRPAAQACLDVESEFAAIEAIERFVAEPEPAIRDAGGAVSRREETAASDAPITNEELRRLVTLLGDLAPALRNGTSVAEGGAAGSPTPPAQPGDEGGGDEPTRIDAAAEPGDSGDPTAAAPAAETAAAAPEPGERAAPVPPQPAPRDLITTTSVNYRTGPSLDAERLGTLPSGTAVLLLRELDGWSAVQLEDGRSVYVASSFLRRPE